MKRKVGDIAIEVMSLSHIKDLLQKFIQMDLFHLYQIHGIFGKY